MKEEEFNARFDDLKYQWHRLSLKMRRLQDKLEWFELADGLMKEEKIKDPLMALLTVDFQNPSRYSYEREKKHFK